MSTAKLFKVMTGTNMVHVPYRSAAAVMTDLLSGQVQLYLRHLRHRRSNTLELANSARWGVTIERPASHELPEDPDCGLSSVPGLRGEQLVTALAHRTATPAEIIDKLNTEINATLADPKMKAQLAELGGTVLAGSPADFGKLIAEETEKWGNVVEVRGHQGGLRRGRRPLIP